MSEFSLYRLWYALLNSLILLCILALKSSRHLMKTLCCYFVLLNSSIFASSRYCNSCRSDCIFKLVAFSRFTSSSVLFPFCISSYKAIIRLSLRYMARSLFSLSSLASFSCSSSRSTSTSLRFMKDSCSAIALPSSRSWSFWSYTSRRRSLSWFLVSSREWICDILREKSC